MSNNNVKLSKALSWILRHGASQEGITIDSGGWVKVDDLLPRRQFNGITLESIQSIVANCPKQRFKLKEEDGQFYIRANQGHSIQVEDLELNEITSWKTGECAIHGTYLKAWESIKTRGLSRMRRAHIHCSAGLPGDTDVISGMRNTSQVLVYIDVPKALEAGFKFFRSENNVILCSGNEAGFLPTEYFSKVVDKRTGQQLL